MQKMSQLPTFLIIDSGWSTPLSLSKAILHYRKWCHSFFSFSNSKWNMVNIADRFIYTNCGGVRDGKKTYVDIVLSPFDVCRSKAVWVRFRFRIHTSTIVNTYNFTHSRRRKFFPILPNINLLPKNKWNDQHNLPLKN